MSGKQMKRIRKLCKLTGGNPEVVKKSFRQLPSTAKHAAISAAELIAQKVQTERNKQHEKTE